MNKTEEEADEVCCVASNLGAVPQERLSSQWAFIEHEALDGFLLALAQGLYCLKAAFGHRRTHAAYEYTI